MKEHKIILEDLKNYLKKRGIKTAICSSLDGWNIIFTTHIFSFHYSILDGSIYNSNGRPTFSLADPQYREKFYDNLMELKDEVNANKCLDEFEKHRVKT